MTFRRWLEIFFVLLLVAALLLGGALAYAIHSVRRADFAQRFGDASLVVQEQPFLDRHRSCDIIVYGDSTASIGVDPRVLNNSLGLTACNLATTRPVVDDLGTLPLDAFLAHNPRPRFLIFQFGPEVFYRNTAWDHDGPFAPMVMLSRDVPTGEAVKLMVRHPAESTQFLIFMLQQRVHPGRHADPSGQFERKLSLFHSSGGLLTLFLPAQHTCSAPALKLYGPPDAAWVGELRRRYQVEGTTVLVRASPIPSCDPQIALFQHDLQSLVDQNVEALPITAFTGGDRHPTLEGSQLATEALVRLIANHR